MRVTVRSFLHLAWVLGTAALVTWVGTWAGTDPNFLVALLCVLTAHSAWKAGEYEEAKAETARAGQGPC